MINQRTDSFMFDVRGNFLCKSVSIKICPSVWLNFMTSSIILRSIVLRQQLLCDYKKLDGKKEKKLILKVLDNFCTFTFNNGSACTSTERDMPSWTQSLKEELMNAVRHEPQRYCQHTIINTLTFDH